MHDNSPRQSQLHRVIGWQRFAITLDGGQSSGNRRLLEKERSSRMKPEDLEDRAIAWRKSRRSVHNGACIEVAQAASARVVVVRDSVDPSGPRVRYPQRAWQSFIADAKRGTL
jgi:hypothetical protein